MFGSATTKIQDAGREAINKFRHMYGRDPLSEADAVSTGLKERMNNLKKREARVAIRQAMVKGVHGKMPTKINKPSGIEQFGWLVMGLPIGLLGILWMTGRNGS